MGTVKMRDPSHLLVRIQIHDSAQDSKPSQLASVGALYAQLLACMLPKVGDQIGQHMLRLSWGVHIITHKMVCYQLARGFANNQPLPFAAREGGRQPL